METKVDEVKARVEKELDELNEKIVRLTSFMFGRNFHTANLSTDMRYMLKDQLRAMQEYAEILQKRLSIWEKSDEDLNNERLGLKYGNRIM